MAQPSGGMASQGPLSRATLIMAAAAILLLGVLGGGAFGWLRRPDPTPAPAPTPAPVSSSATGSNSPTPVPSSTSPLSTSPSPSPSEPSKKELEEQARDQLDSLADDGYEAADPNGQWVAQLSSKWIGITDPEQTAAVSGGHTFAAVDIVAEYEATKHRAEDIGGASIVLIKGSDIKKGRDETSAHLFWYIFAVDFTSQSDAEDWCHDLYPRLSGDRLKNVCYATQLKP